MSKVSGAILRGSDQLATYVDFAPVLMSIREHVLSRDWHVSNVDAISLEDRDLDERLWRSESFWVPDRSSLPGPCRLQPRPLEAAVVDPVA